MIFSRVLLTLSLSLSLSLTAAWAQPKPTKPVPPISRNAAGLALKGYDPVAYFEVAKAVPGSPEFSHEFDGAKFLFRSETSKALFVADPAKYMPQYGGYCAWAVGHNYTAPADPEAWKMVDGKLYLNYNKGVQLKWIAEEGKLISAGDSNWAGLH